MPRRRSRGRRSRFTGDAHRIDPLPANRRRHPHRPHERAVGVRPVTDQEIESGMRGNQHELTGRAVVSQRDGRPRPEPCTRGARRKRRARGHGARGAEHGRSRSTERAHQQTAQRQHHRRPHTTRMFGRLSACKPSAAPAAAQSRRRPSCTARVSVYKSSAVRNGSSDACRIRDS